MLGMSCRWGGWIKRGSVATFLALAVTGALLAPIARADGDPASDYLVANQVFLAYQATPASPLQRQLVSVVQDANRAGFAIRVAIIPSEYDLGSITELWRKPRIYARFLGLELSSAYKQRLLVAMPNGFGFNWPGHPLTSAYHSLADVPIGAGGTALTAAAQIAVRRLAAASGIKLAPATESSTTARSPAKPSRTWVAVVIAAALAALIGAVLAAVTLRRRRGRGRPTTPRVAPAAAGPHSHLRRSWALPGLAVALVLAVGASVLVIAGRRHPSASDQQVGSIVTPPPFSWPSGRRPAPEFVLRDQDGRRVSLTEYRGRPLIVTFVDPLCRNLCPLEAKLLNDVVAGMPASRRPAVLAVSVDVYADARANLLQDEHKWELVPQWHWAVGPPAQLAAVWKRYAIGVLVTTKRIAGTTIKYITHTEAAYIIDSSGHERALFLWPFYPQDVEHTLRRIA